MSGWGREDESSSSISTLSSSHSRRREPEIDVLAVRNRIVDKIMAKKQKEEAEKAKETSASKRKSRVPLADLAQSQEEMDLTQVASTSTNAGNLNWTLDSTKRESKVYSSTPLTGRSDPQRESTSTSEFVAPRPKISSKSKPPKTSVIVEDESEEESPPPPRFPPPQAPPKKVPAEGERKRGRPRKDQSTSKSQPSARPKPRSPTPEPQPLAFESSDDEGPPARPGFQSDQEEEAGPSTRQTSRVSVPKSPRRGAADRSRQAPPRSPAAAPRETPAKPSKATPAKPSKITPAKPSRATPAVPTDSPGDPGPSTSRASGASQNEPSRASSRRKAPPKRASPTSRKNKLYKELRRLQSEPGFLIPRLPFMRVVREIASNVARADENFKFTVDAMEAIQTATEYYLTSVFTDAAALANHAHRVTVMPRDLDLLRKLRVVDM